MRPADLPAPDSDALAASELLRERIREELRVHGGWISFARYMELVLHQPGLGYYAAGAAKLGAGGDFVTAPELGPLFGRTLARQFAQVFEQSPRPAILELGAGSGALAAVLLDEFPGIDYRILETSADLRDRQRRLLGDRAHWLDALPARVEGVVIANEVADAIPVHAVAWTHEGAMERGVIEAGGRLAWADRAATAAVAGAAAGIAVELPPSGRYESEIGLAARAWMRELASRLAHGALFVIDYGFCASEYYHPQRSMGTLSCHYRHRTHADVFLHPGLQDVTAHVDFSALAHAACDSGLALLGYTTQAAFLAACGITEVLAGYDAGDPQRYLPRAAEARVLLSPAEMGELFKVLAVGRGIDAPLVGFSRGDRAHTL
ncbi:MAG: class I SAM-dependent methyltransferase [Burkholderiales bacterium]